MFEISRVEGILKAWFQQQPMLLYVMPSGNDTGAYELIDTISIGTFMVNSKVFCRALTNHSPQLISSVNISL